MAPCHVVPDNLSVLPVAATLVQGSGAGHSRIITHVKAKSCVNGKCCQASSSPAGQVLCTAVGNSLLPKHDASHTEVPMLLRLSPVQAPVISSVATSPSLVSAGQSFAVSVTLQAPIETGSLSITSTPTGIICPSRSIGAAENPIVLTCTAPVAGTAAAAAAAQAVQQAAAVQVAAVSGASEQQAEVAWMREPPTPTRQYRLTATVTADSTAIRDTTVTVSLFEAARWGRSMRVRSSMRSCLQQ
jgi:hypothetical protein